MADYSQFFNTAMAPAGGNAATIKPAAQEQPEISASDKKLLKMYKDEGKSATEAFASLGRVKDAYGTTDNFFVEFPKQLEQQRRNEEVPWGIRFFGGIIPGAIKGAVSTVQGISDIGHKALLGASDVTGLTAATEGLTGKKMYREAPKLPEEWRTPRGAGEQLGFGLEQFGEFLIPAGQVTKLSKAAQAVKFLKGGGKLKKAGRFATGVGTEAGAIATHMGVQKGELPSAGDFAIAAGAGSAVKGIGAILKAFKSGSISEKLAKLGGASDETIAAVKDKVIGQMVAKKLPTAKEAMKNPTLNSPLMAVGEQTLKPSVKLLAQSNKQLGQNIAKTLKASGVKLDTSRALDAFKKTIKDLNGKITKDGISFPGYSKIKSKADIKHLNNVYQDLMKYRYAKKPISVDKIWSLRQSIDNTINYNKAGRVLEPLSGVGEIPLSTAARTLQDDIVRAVPQSTKLFKQFGDERKVLDWFNSKLGDNSSPASVLKNIFSPLAKGKAVPRLKELGKMTKKDILAETRAAKTAMDIVGDDRATQLISAVGSPKSTALQTVINKIVNPEKRIIALMKAMQMDPPREGSKEMAYLIMALIANGGSNLITPSYSY